MRHTLLRRIAVGSGAVTIALTTALSGIAAADETPSNGAQSGQHVDQPASTFVVSAKFDKPSYHVSDEISGSISATNNGTAAVHVHFSATPDNLSLTRIGWSDIWTGTPGIDIAPGQTITRGFAGTVEDAAKPVTITAGLMGNPAIPNLVTDQDTATAAIVVGKGDIDGTLYYDKNGNGSFDQGEGLPDVKVTISGGAPSHTLPPVKTDQDGKFKVTDVPSGTYSASYEGLGDLVPQSAGWRVDQGTVQVVSEARRKVSDTLTASTKFTADTYKVGDTAHVTVTMKNSGDRALAGITVMCGIGDPHELKGRSDGWGDLQQSGRGVAVPAHGTTTLDVTEAVPSGARSYGYVRVRCDFGQFNAGFYDGAERAPVDRVHVPGAISNVLGGLGNVTTKVVPAGVKLYLVDEISAKPVANTVTDAKGGFSFKGLPAGLYRTVLVGPWKLVAGQSPIWDFTEGDLTGRDIAVEPGPNQPDPYAPTTAPTTPTPQALRVLANTGAADVQALTGAAILAMVLGVGLVLLSRRRRTS